MKSKIAVKVKTMHGTRKTHTLTVSILDKVSKLIELLTVIEPDDMQNYHTTKFIYAMGALKTLDLEQTFIAQSIPCGA